MGTSLAGVPAADTSVDPGAIPFEDFVNENLGYAFVGGSETPPAAGGDTPAPATGTTPAAGTEGNAPAERAGDTPADATVAAPDTNALVPPAQAEGDPLEGATGFAYVVNGQSRQTDDIRVLKDGGAIILPEAFPKIAQRLSERDHYFEQNRDLYAKQQEFERLSSWQIPGADGKLTDVKGRDGLVALHSDFARETSAGQVVLDLLTSKGLNGYLHTAEDGRIVLSPAGTEYLRTQIENAQFRALQATSARMGELSKPAAPTAPAPMAPERVMALAPGVIDHALTEAGLPVALLTAQDRQILGAQMSRFLAVENGAQVVDRQFAALVKQMAEMRKETASNTTAVTEAAKANAARIAAATRAPARPGARPAAPNAATQREDDQDAAWDLRFNAAASAMRR